MKGTIDVFVKGGSVAEVRGIPDDCYFSLYDADINANAEREWCERAIVTEQCVLCLLVLSGVVYDFAVHPGYTVKVYYED